MSLSDYTHAMRHILPRIAAKLVYAPDTQCWRWTGATHRDTGRPICRGESGAVIVPRVVWAELRDTIAPGKKLVNTCGLEACCNPDHHRPKTPSETLKGTQAGQHTARRMLAITHCPRGHEYAGSNLRVYDGRRHCRMCQRARNQRRRAAQRAV